jgi:hypothetical protein
MDDHAIRSRLARIAGTRLKRAVVAKQPPFIPPISTTSYSRRADEVPILAPTGPGFHPARERLGYGVPPRLVIERSRR